MRRATAFGLAAMMPWTTACSLAASSSQMINVVPSNPNAEVYVDGNLVGTGPQAVRMSKRSSHSVMAKCKSSTGMAMVDREFSTTGILDLVGGVIILVPLIGLFAPGSRRLTPSTITVAGPDESSCEGDE